MGGTASVEIPGGGSEGYHILNVQDNSPGERSPVLWLSAYRWHHAPPIGCIPPLPFPPSCLRAYFTGALVLIPAHTGDRAGLESFFDFIIAVNGVRLVHPHSHAAHMQKRTSMLLTRQHCTTPHHPPSCGTAHIAPWRPVCVQFTRPARRCSCVAGTPLSRG